MSQTTSSSAQQKNGNKILQGFRRLGQTQKPGQTFSQAEIARACNVDRRSIGRIEERALHTFARRLHASDRQLISEIFADKPIKEIFDRIGHAGDSKRGQFSSKSRKRRVEITEIL